MSKLPMPAPDSRAISIPSGDESTQKLIAAMPFPVRKRDFFRAWLALAFRHAWGWQDGLASLIGLVFPIITKFIPASESAMKDLAWQIPLAAFGTLAVMRLVLSPYWLFKERNRQSVDQESKLRHEIEQEKARYTEPKLAGRIVCLNHDVAWDLEHFGVDRATPLKLKVTFACNVCLWNETPTPTTVSGFSLCVRWRDREYQADQLPVEGYSIRRGFPRPEPEEWGYEVRSESLVGFPNDLEITNRNHIEGWLRFLARDIPSGSDDKPVLGSDVTWQLYAHDRKGQPHKIYEGTWDLPVCGDVERDNKFLFA